tara:strand:- start:182 stop:1144 length:963 start_codon:yes stop_codon:yes gene_type:complete
MTYIKPRIIKGCTDNGKRKWSKYPGYPACNYDVNVNTDDGSCEYDSCLGCTDSKCDESYSSKYKIPAQLFYGYGVCEPCSYVNVPTNNYPPIKGEDFSSPKQNFTYERGNVIYNKPFGELSFGYLTTDEIQKTISMLKRLSVEFSNFDLWIYGEIVDNIPARDVKIIMTSKSKSAFNKHEISNFINMAIQRTKKDNVCLNIRYHKKNLNNGLFYSSSLPVGQNLKITTFVPYDVIKYNGKVIEINNGRKLSGVDLWAVPKIFPDKNKTNYYRKKGFTDRGIVNINSNLINKVIDDYGVNTDGDAIFPETIHFIRHTKPFN